MRYLTTLDVWNVSVQQAILHGQIKLQVGQWLTCGDSSEHKSRYVGNTRLTLDLVHWQGSPRATNKLFLMRLNRRNV